MLLLVVVEVGRRRGSERVDAVVVVVVAAAEVDVDVVVVARVEVEMDQVVVAARKGRLWVRRIHEAREEGRGARRVAGDLGRNIFARGAGDALTSKLGLNI